jgi:hypothetical protein
MRHLMMTTQGITMSIQAFVVSVRHTNRFQVVGINDERDYCECCGKKGLKRVVWVRDTETDEVKHFGTTCANAPVKGFNLQAEIKEAIAKFDSRQQVVSHMSYHEYKRHGGKHIPHPTKPHTWMAETPELYAAVRAEISARTDFNY